MARLLIGISTYNEFEHLELLLQSIDWYTYYPKCDYQVVVCDDGSEPAYLENTRDVCRKWGAALIENGVNQGIPITWNHLSDSAPDSEIVVLLNNDIIVPPNWLRVADHFLTANKDNPTVGTMFWNPYNNFSKEMMRAILPLLGHTIFKSADHLSGSENWFDHAQNCSPAVTDPRQGQGQGLGRCMCPCGCCFAFRREVYEEVKAYNSRRFGAVKGHNGHTYPSFAFDPRIRSFHEESQFGTICAALGRAAFGFAYPRPYHKHGYTFGMRQELQGSVRMQHSRELYREWWDVPGHERDYFTYVNHQLMSKIPITELKFLTPDYTAGPDKYTLVGGETVLVPKLVETVGAY